MSCWLFYKERSFASFHTINIFKLGFRKSAKYVNYCLYLNHDSSIFFYLCTVIILQPSRNTVNRVFMCKLQLRILVRYGDNLPIFERITEYDSSLHVPFEQIIQSLSFMFNNPKRQIIFEIL